MMNMQLFLLGEPRLVVNDIEQEVRPRAVFELLALILLAGTSGIDRGEAAEKLWGQLGEPNCRQQLRIALAKLRVFLMEWRVQTSFQLDGPRLISTCSYEIDVHAIRNWPADKKHAEAATRPVCEGWRLEHWYQLHDEVGAEVSALIERYCDRDKNTRNRLSVLSKATAAYPTASGLHSRLALELQRGNREAELNECVIRFEEAWLDRFGHTGIPKILPETIETDRASVRKQLGSWRIFLLCSLVFVGIFGVFRTSESGPPLKEPTVKRQPDFIHGSESFQVWKISLSGTRRMSECGLNELAAGSYLLNFKNHDMDLQLVINPNGQWRWLKQSERKRQLIDTDGTISAYSEDGPSAVIDWKDKRIDLDYKADFPLSSVVAVMRNHTALIYRSSADDSVSHHKYTLWRDGKEAEIQFPEGMRTARVWALNDRLIAGSYSYGPADDWRYRSFTYDILTHEFTPTACKPIARVLPDGRFLTRPLTNKGTSSNIIMKEEGLTYIEPADGTVKSQVFADGSAMCDRAGVLGDILLLVDAPELGPSKIHAIDASGQSVTLPGAPDGVVGACYDGRMGTALLYRIKRESRDTIDLYLLAKCDGRLARMPATQPN